VGSPNSSVPLVLSPASSVSQGSMWLQRWCLICSACGTQLAVWEFPSTWSVVIEAHVNRRHSVDGGKLEIRRWSVLLPSTHTTSLVWQSILNQTSLAG